MSQAGKLTQGNTPPSVATHYVTDVNSDAIPILNVLQVLGNSTSDDSTAGIITDGSSGSNVLTVLLTNTIVVTHVTVDNTSFDVIQFDMGAAGAFNFDIDVCAYDAVGNTSASWNIFAAMCTNGVAATLEIQPIRKIVKNIALDTTDATVAANGNEIWLTVKGIAGSTIDWFCRAKYIRTT